MKLLPVERERELPAADDCGQRSERSILRHHTPGTIHIELRHAQVRIEGNADPALLRVVLECLRG